MASYKALTIIKNVLVEQNIYSDSELASFGALFTDLDNTQYPFVLAYFEDEGKRLYSIEVKKWASNYHVIGELTDVFRWKTAKARRKRIGRMIFEHEASLGNRRKMMSFRSSEENESR